MVFKQKFSVIIFMNKDIIGHHNSTAAVMESGLVHKYKRFRGTYCLLVATYKSTPCYYPEDQHRHIHERVCSGHIQLVVYFTMLSQQQRLYSAE